MDPDFGNIVATLTPTIHLLSRNCSVRD